jgi:hypothetical protein
LNYLKKYLFIFFKKKRKTRKTTNPNLTGHSGPLRPSQAAAAALCPSRLLSARWAPPGPLLPPPLSPSQPPPPGSCVRARRAPPCPRACRRAPLPRSFGHGAGNRRLPLLPLFPLLSPSMKTSIDGHQLSSSPVVSLPPPPPAPSPLPSPLSIKPPPPPLSLPELALSLSLSLSNSS